MESLISPIPSHFARSRFSSCLTSRDCCPAFHVFPSAFSGAATILSVAIVMACSFYSIQHTFKAIELHKLDDPPYNVTTGVGLWQTNDPRPDCKL